MTNTTVHVPSRWGLYARAVSRIGAVLMAGLAAAYADNRLSVQEGLLVGASFLAAWSAWMDQSLGNYTSVQTGEVQAETREESESDGEADAAPRQEQA